MRHPIVLMSADLLISARRCLYSVRTYSICRTFGGRMSVRRGLLAILDQGPCYGYQLRAEYARRTGASLNVGQIYTTLERLERDGLVEKRGADERGHVYWGITAEGSADAAAWFSAPEARPARDEAALKIALAASLPGVDAAAAVAAQRRDAQARLDALAGDSDGDLPAAVLRAAARAHAEAELAWLDAVAADVGGDPAVRTYALSAERPRRGRPARVAP
jgi:DNA-binding PadR family transcriptional regulator